MLDINLLRKDLDFVVARLETRKNPQPYLATAEFVALETERRQIQVHCEKLQNQSNVLNKQIGLLRAKAMPNEQCAALLLMVAPLKTDLTRAQARLIALQALIGRLTDALPNLPHQSVPLGHGESENVVVRSWGIPKAFDFEVKDHTAVGTPLGLDLAMGAKLTGSRFAVMTCGVARMHRALGQFMLDVQTLEHGYTECYVPYIVNADSLRGTGQLPKFEGDLFAAKKGGQDGEPENAALYLIPTGEVPLTNFVRSVVLSEKELPLKLTAHTPCFRSEAGSAGRDTHGLIRQHQFDKVEMVQIVHPAASYEALETMVGHAEAILQKLGLPYRVVSLCTGDLGFGAAKTYDLEVWLPGQNMFREISSVSNCEAFQARRLQARFKNAEGTNAFVHTLNGSGLATGRALVAVLENYQNADGSVTVPEALQPYMGGLTKIV